MLNAWQACLLEAIETAERIGMTEDSTEAALCLVRNDGSYLRYTLRECIDELSTLTATDKPC